MRTRPARPRAPPLSQADKDTVARRKRAVTDSITGFEELQVRKATRHDVHAQLDPAKDVWDELWSLWLLTGKTNRRWLQMDASFYEKHRVPESSDCRRRWVFNRLIRYEAHQLKPPLRAFQRWKSWAQARAPECSLVQPDPVTLFTFLEYVAEGGPTAARSLWNQLMFLKTKVGLNFPLEDMKEFVTGIGLLLLLRRAAGAGRVAVQMVLLPLLACLRWRHVQRSFFTHKDQALWYGTCLQGKRRVQNTYPPYDWCVPCLDSLVFGQPDLLESPNWTDGLETLYNEVLARLAPGKRPFLVPGLRRDKIRPGPRAMLSANTERGLSFSGVFWYCWGKVPLQSVILSTLCAGLCPHLRGFSS